MLPFQDILRYQLYCINRAVMCLKDHSVCKIPFKVLAIPPNHHRMSSKSVQPLTCVTSLIEAILEMYKLEQAWFS